MSPTDTPVQADGKPLIVTIERQPGRFDRFAPDAFASQVGRTVPLTAAPGSQRVIGRATIQRAAVNADGNVSITATVEATRHAPDGYLDALRDDPSWALTVNSWEDAQRGTVREARVHTFWPGPAHPVAPSAPGRKSVQCIECRRTVLAPCETETESGLCLRCLNGGPPGKDTTPASAVARVAELLNKHPDHALLSVARVRAALYGNAL